MELLCFLAILLINLISIMPSVDGTSAKKFDSGYKNAGINKDDGVDFDSDQRVRRSRNQNRNYFQDDAIRLGTFPFLRRHHSLMRSHRSQNNHVSVPSQGCQDNHPCLVTSLGVDVVVDCSNCNLATIDSTWFPANTSHILFENNLLEELQNGTFLKLDRLRNISFSHNSLRFIDAGVFLGLNSLESLNLEYNSIDVLSAICKSEILNTLINLKELFLMGNPGPASRAQYPIGCLPCLEKLEALSIDTAGDSLQFGREFRSATRLSRLEISGGVKIINDSSFENVPLLKRLVLFELEDIVSISQDAFGPLGLLDSLRMDRVPLGLMKTLKLFRPLRNRNMSSVALKMVEYTVYADDGSLLMRDCFIDRNKTRYLTSICVRDFTLTNSQIFVMQEDALYSRVWDKCLRSIDLSDNPLCGTREAFLRLMTFKSLERITVADTLRARSDKIPFWTEETNILKENTAEGNVKLNRETFAKSPSKPRNGQITQQQQNVSYTTRPESKLQTSETAFPQRLGGNKSMASLSTNNGKNLISLNSSIALTEVGYTIYLSSSLRVVNFRRFIESSSLNNIKATLIGGENVEYFDISDSGFREFNVVIRGLTNLKTFILSGNDLSTLSVTVFDTFPSIQDLAISDCSLDSAFMSVNSGRIFQPLRKLQRLDLSSNLLSLLSPLTFASNSDMTRLSLAENRFRDFPFDLKQTPNLRELRLQKNALTTLDNEIRDELDNLATRWGTFTLFLDGNILSCGCQSLRFLLWLQSTTVMLDNGGNYSCMNNDGLLVDTKTFENLDGLWRVCSGEFYLYVSLVLFCVIVIGFLLVFVITKKKTFIVSHLLQMFGGFKLLRARDYRIGVFIGYPDRDYTFSCHHLRAYIEDVLGLTTFVRDRDLLPSSDVGRGLSEAINLSWRIALVLGSGSIRDDEWMLFTIRSAVYAQTPANPSRVVVLVDEKRLHEVPMELWSAVSEDNIVVVKNWTLSYEVMETLRTRLL